MNITYNIKDLRNVATQVLDHSKSKTISFYGAMGTGKTTLIKALVTELGGEDMASSPTFSIVNEYDTDLGKVYHFDMYRLNDISEAYDIGIEDYLYSGHYCFIEWPEKIESLLPEDINSIELNINSDNSRSLKLNYAMNLTN